MNTCPMSYSSTGMRLLIAGGFSPRSRLPSVGSEYGSREASRKIRVSLSGWSSNPIAASGRRIALRRLSASANVAITEATVPPFDCAYSAVHASAITYTRVSTCARAAPPRGVRPARSRSSSAPPPPSYPQASSGSAGVPPRASVVPTRTRSRPAGSTAQLPPGAFT